MTNMAVPQSSLFWVLWLHLLTQYLEREPNKKLKATLIAQGCSPNVAMYVAIKERDSELLEAALGEGANLYWSVDGKAVVFETLWWHSVNDIKVLGTILDHTRADKREAICKSWLHRICWDYRWNFVLKAIQMILDKSNVIDSVGEDGRTALMHASLAFVHPSFNNYPLEGVHFLLRAGANRDIRDSEGRTALFHAAKNGANPVVKTLLQAGASPWIADHDGLTPIDVAKFKNTKKMLARAMKDKAPNRFEPNLKE